MIAICNSDPDRQGSSLWGTSDFFALEEDSGKMQVLASLTNVPSGNHGQPNPVSVIQIGKDIYGFTQEGIDGYHERQDTTYKKHIYALINQEIVPSLTIETRTVSCIDEDGICYFKERNFIIDVSRPANNTYPVKITGEMWKERTDDNSRNISRKNIHLLKVCHLTFDIKDGKYKYLENINDPEKGCHK